MRRTRGTCRARLEGRHADPRRRWRPRLLTVATGGDTSGSIRNPATFCGRVGMKPTYGRVSRRGIVVISWSLDHVGPMTRTVADNAMPVEGDRGTRRRGRHVRAAAGAGLHAARCGAAVRGMRVAIPKPAELDGYHADVDARVSRRAPTCSGSSARTCSRSTAATAAVVDDVPADRAHRGRRRRTQSRFSRRKSGRYG